MRRGLWWAGVLVAVAAIAVGAVTAYRGYTRTERPETVVRAYYAALARADAPAALAFGDAAPTRPALLTSTVLREQQRLAPMRDISATRLTSSGAAAEVAVRYELGPAGGSQVVTDTVAVHRRDRTWRLDRIAVTTRLQVAPAGDRATLLGGPVPTRAVTLFPGAVPVRLDTTTLRLAAGHDALTFAARPTTDLTVELSAGGRQAAGAAVVAALRRCLTGSGPASCPLPGERYVPGSLRGTIAAGQHLTSTLGVQRAGVVEVAGSVRVEASYRRLTFQNVATAGTGALRLPVHAQLYASRPSSVVWNSA